MAAKDTLVEVTLTHERDTKGTRVFSSNDDTAAISPLYIRKPAADTLPDEIVVRISAA